MENIAVTQGNIICMIVTAALLLILPVVYVIVWKRRQRDRITWNALFIGALGFFVSARVLELIVHMFCIVRDNPVSRFINGHTAVYVLYGVVMAGVFEECGRHIIIGKLLKKVRTRENAVMYGIGHGGIEVWVVSLMTIVSYLIIGVTARALGVNEALAQLGAAGESMDAVLPVVTAVAGFGPESVFMTVIERALCMLLHIALTVIVFYGIHCRKRRYLLYAVLGHMAVDVFPALYQRGVCSMAVCEVWLAVWTAILGAWALLLYKRCEVQ